MTAFLVVFNSPKIHKRQERSWLLWSWLGKALKSDWQRSSEERAGVVVFPLVSPVCALFSSVSLGNKRDPGERRRDETFISVLLHGSRDWSKCFLTRQSVSAGLLTEVVQQKQKKLLSQENVRNVYMYYIVLYFFLFVSLSFAVSFRVTFYFNSWDVH